MKEPVPLISPIEKKALDMLALMYVDKLFADQDTDAVNSLTKPNETSDQLYTDQRQRSIPLEPGRAGRKP